MENSTGKMRKILKINSEKYLRICTVNGDIQAKGVNKTQELKYIKKGKLGIRTIRCSKRNRKKLT
jgi:hypothetical protein